MIHYTEKGYGMHEAIARVMQADGTPHWLREENRDWISSNDEIVQAIMDAYDPLIVLRAQTSVVIAAERTRRQQLGMHYSFSDGIKGTAQTRNEQDLINVNGQVTAALVLQAQGVTAAVLSFRDAENVTHPMTPMQTIMLGMAVSAFVSSTYVAKWQHDTAIAVWDGVDPYDLTAYWPG